VRPSERPLETRQDKWMPAETPRRLRETTEDQQRPLETKGNPWRPDRNGDQAETHGDQGRPAETPGDQARQLHPSRNHWRPAETPGDQ